MSFNPDILKSKLAALNETQESVTSLSQWIMFHKRHAATSAEVWAEYVAEAPVKSKLALVYLANDVVQQAKSRKKDEFVQAFAVVIPEALEHVYGVVEKPIKDRINRVVKVWSERNVLPPAVQQDIEGRLGNESALAAVLPELIPVTKFSTQYFKARQSAKTVSEKAKAEVDRFLAQEQASAIQALQTVSQLERTLEQSQATVEKCDELRTAAISALKDLIDTLESQEVFTLESSSRDLELKKAELLSRIDDDDELPSPNVEPTTPPAAEAEVEAQAEEEYVPSVYTAKDAQASYAAPNDDDEVAYVESSDEEEPEAKKPKLDLDPKLASFLASMAGK